MTTEDVQVSSTGGALGQWEGDAHPAVAVRVPRPGAGAVARRRALLRQRLTPLVLLAADGAATATALLLADAGEAARAMAPALAVLVALHAHAGLYRPGLSAAALDELPVLLRNSLLTWCVVTTGLVVLDPADSTGWGHLLLLLAVHAPLMCVGRAAAHLALRRLRRRAPCPTLVVGAGPVGERVLATLLAAPGYGLRPVGLVDPNPPAAPGPPTGPQSIPPPGAAVGEGPAPLGEGAAPLGEGAQTGSLVAKPSVPVVAPPPPGPVVPRPLPVPVLAGHEEVNRAIAAHGVRAVILTRTPWEDPDVAALLGLLRDRGCTVWLVTTAPELALAPAREAVPDHLWGFSCRRLAPPPRHRVAALGKRALDVCAASLGLVLAAPLLVACALAVRCADGPGVLFRQERVGRDGHPFVVLKFRTLRSDAYESATRWSVADDRRMSTVGRWLRRTSLDELPQLWNVLRGDMSLVGPRPERPYFVREFSQRYPTYRARHRMPVGITGLAQVHGLRGDTSIEDRVRFDNHYIETWSLWQDLRILLRTAGALFRWGGS